MATAGCLRLPIRAGRLICVDAGFGGSVAYPATRYPTPVLPAIVWRVGVHVRDKTPLHGCPRCAIAVICRCRRCSPASGRCGARALVPIFAPWRVRGRMAARRDPFRPRQARLHGEHTVSATSSPLTCRIATLTGIRAKSGAHACKRPARSLRTAVRLLPEPYRGETHE